MSDNGWIILAIANIPIYYFIGKIFWDDWGEFWESLRFWITPNLISMINGDYWDDLKEEFKLGIWAVLCTACVVLEGLLITEIF